MQDFINNIIEGDALNKLSQIPSNYVDLIVTDPPYYTAVRELLSEQFQTFDDYLSWYEKWLIEVQRVLKEDGSIYIFMPPLEFAEIHILIKKYFYQKQVISWIKPNVMIRQPTAKNYFPKTEFIGFYTKSQENHVWNMLIKKYGMQNSCNFMIESMIHRRIQEGVDHPTQKPLKLCAKFIYASSNENDVILDPFCGSGTTLVAAKILKRKFIGIEISSKYCSMSRGRIGRFSDEDLEEKPEGVIF